MLKSHVSAAWAGKFEKYKSICIFSPLKKTNMQEPDLSV
jgi:hypothetical protein